MSAALIARSRFRTSSLLSSHSSLLSYQSSSAIFPSSFALVNATSQASSRSPTTFPQPSPFSSMPKRNASQTSMSDSNDQSKKSNTNGSSGEEQVAEWKKRAPYRIHEPNEHFDAKLEASCHCGAVKYQLSRDEPLASKLCHCTTCQTQHAAPFQWAAIFHKTDINFSHGHHNLEWYDPTEKSIEHKLPCKVRCNYCHSPIMDEGRNMILLFPTLIHMKTQQVKDNFKPRCHMFYGQRVMDIPDGLPKWTGINNTSDLMEDSPQDMVRDLERKRAQEKEEKLRQRGEGEASQA